MIRLIILLYFLSSIPMFAQKRIYLDEEKNNTSNRRTAKFYKISYKDSVDSNLTIEEVFFNTGTKESITPFSDYKRRIQHGTSVSFFHSGMISETIDYKNGSVDGKLKVFWNNGSLRREDLYTEGKYISGTCFDSTGVKIKHYPYETAPKFPGGMTQLYKFIFDNIQYSFRNQANGVNETVTATFIIKKDGSVGDIKLSNGSNHILALEVYNVLLKMPKWKPATGDGIPIDSPYSLPIIFTVYKN